MIWDIALKVKRFSAPKTLEEEEHLLAFIFISVFFKSFGAFFQENNVLLFSYPKRSFYGNYRQTWTNKQRWTRLDNITQDWYIIADKHQECDVNIFIMGIIYPKIMCPNCVHTKLSCSVNFIRWHVTMTRCMVTLTGPSHNVNWNENIEADKLWHRCFVEFNKKFQRHQMSSWFKLVSHQ